MFRKRLSGILLSSYSFFCLVCLSWSADAKIRAVKEAVRYLLEPATYPILSQLSLWGNFGENTARLLRQDRELRLLEEARITDALQQVRYASMEQENLRLAALLDLEKIPVFKPLVARVWARDAHDWFHSVLLRRGREDGVRPSDPVVNFQDGHLLLLGQILEISEKTSRLLLITDPLSAVYARVSRSGEQGVIEGQGRGLLVMNYLFWDSDVRVGDEVVTTGLGGVFPAEVLVGHVESIASVTRETFKTVYVKPAAGFGRLQEAIVLIARGGESK